MPNLFVNPVVITPNLQSLGEFPTAGTSDNQLDPKESSFSKLLAATVDSKPSQREISASPKKKPLPQKETSFKKTPVKTEEQQQIARNEEAGSQVKEPEPKLNQSDSEESANLEQSQAEEKVDSDEKATSDTQAEQDNELAVVLLLAQSVAGSQPLIDDIPVETVNADSLVIDRIVSGITTTELNDSKQLADEANAKVQLTELNNSQATADVQSLMQSKTITGQTMVSAVKQTEAVAQSTTVVDVAAPSLKNSSANQQQQITGSNQNGTDINDKSAGNTIDILIKSGDGQKGLVDPELLADTNDKANNQINAEMKGDTPYSVKEMAKDGKTHSLNLQLIQTQLSVNGSADKTRADLPLVSTIQQPQTTPDSEITALTTNHVNKEDLFAQIVEKAKVLINNGHSEMEVSLKPAHLGKLQLKISVENQIVTAQFVAESQQVKEIIETNLNQLRRNLQDTGVQVDQLMVSVGQQNNNDGFREASQFQGEFTSRHGSNVNEHESRSESLSDNLQEKSSLRETLVDFVA